MYFDYGCEKKEEAYIFFPITDELFLYSQSKGTTNGRVMELVKLLKKRSPACFNVFLEVLKETSQEHLASKLQKSLRLLVRSEYLQSPFHHSPVAFPFNPDGSPEKEKVKDFLVHHFHGSRKLTATDLRLMENELVLYEDYEAERDKLESEYVAVIQQRDTEIDDLNAKVDCYEADIQEYQAKLNQLQSELDHLRGNTSRAISRSSSQSSELTARFSPDGELREIIKQKDQTIRRNTQEYERLKKIREEIEADYQSQLDLNSQYLMIISQLDDMQRNGTRNPTEQDSADYAEIEEKLESAEIQVSELSQKLEETSESLVETKQELEEVLLRERKVKGELGLSEEANERQVMQRIRELAEGDKLRKKEVEKLRKALADVKISRSHLEDRVTCLEREKEQVNFHIRQQDLFIKKLVRIKNAKETIDSASAMIGGRLKSSSQLPSISVTSLEIDKTKLKLRTSSEVASQFCVLCRKDINHMNSVCRFHFRALRGGRWLCCRDECYHSAGCLRASHFYIEFSSDKRVFLTNGQQYLPLT